MFAKELRPRKFEEIIGHEKIVKAFTKKAEVTTFDYSDVIFMVGATGSGKTTSAFIIASLINCKNPVKNKKGYYDPCMECPSCKSVLNETFSQDIHFYKSSEMDKDSILDLEETASSSPLWGGNKQVIIIDELQNLGKSGKGATLNLLEKKRKDTVFILCTMDVYSIDKSITSRGQVYTFKPLSTAEIGKVLISQLDLVDPDQKIPFDPNALVLLAQNSFGSARQGLQYLERCLDSEMYTVEDIEKELSFISEAKAFQMMEKLLSKDSSFYDDIDAVTNIAFYTYSWAVLSNIKKSLLTLEKDDWKYSSSNRILNNSNYSSLVETYIKINEQTGGYFKDYIFNLFIGDYLYQQVPVLTRKERLPRSSV